MGKQYGVGGGYEFAVNNKAFLFSDIAFLSRKTTAFEDTELYQTFRIALGWKNSFNILRNDNISHSISIYNGINYSSARFEGGIGRASKTGFEFDPGVAIGIINYSFKKVFVDVSIGTSYKFTTLDVIPFEGVTNKYKISQAKKGFNSLVVMAIGYKLQGF